jgi:ABC-type sugar transport system substrate-binding protein
MRKKSAFAVAMMAALAGIASRAGGSPHPESVLVILAENGTSLYFQQVARGTEHAAKKANPAVQFTAVSSNNDPAVQTEHIESAIRNHTDLIVIQRTYAGDGSAAIQRARAAGIVAAAIDADVPGGTEIVVKPDERQGGLHRARPVPRRWPTGTKRRVVACVVKTDSADDDDSQRRRTYPRA